MSVISKDTTFLPPCWVGTGSTISGATIGPNTVVGENCVIASGVRIEDSYVLSNTFIPSNAQLSGVVAGVGGILTHATGARYSSQPELS